MTPEFAEPVNKVFDIVLDYVESIERRERPDLGAAKNEIRVNLDALTSTASREPGKRQDEFKLAQRALIYWADEVLTVAQPQWKESTLEFDFYAERNRAWRFYDYGEKAVRTSSSDVIETWYLCLVLGFEGDIGEAFREHLHQPLPGGTNKSIEARHAWAAELARLIRKPAHVELTGEPISGGVEPLIGATWLHTMWACLAVASVGFVVLLAIFLQVRSQ